MLVPKMLNDFLGCGRRGNFSTNPDEFLHISSTMDGYAYGNFPIGTIHENQRRVEIKSALLMDRRAKNEQGV
jgi:hypothetical protein